MHSEKITRKPNNLSFSRVMGFCKPFLLNKLISIELHHKFSSIHHFSSSNSPNSNPPRSQRWLAQIRVRRQPHPLPHQDAALANARKLSLFPSMSITPPLSSNHARRSKNIKRLILLPILETRLRAPVIRPLLFHPFWLSCFQNCMKTSLSHKSIFQLLLESRLSMEMKIRRHQLSESKLTTKI